jgi:hypothetical protein
LRKAHMLLEQMGIPIIETHAVLVSVVPQKSDSQKKGSPSPPRAKVVAA